MKNILLLLTAIIALMTWSCDKMYDKHEAYEGEIVYPAKFDTIHGRIGFERVELDLMKAGRISGSQIRMGKAKSTVIEYDDQIIVIDSIVSWVNIEGLTQTKLYRFKVYTTDEFGNKSVPQEIALIPFTSDDLSMLAITPPRIMTSPTAAVIDWPNNISSVIMNYVGLSFEYTNRDGVVQSGERGSDSRFFIGNVEPGKPVNINMEYQIVPIVNRMPILDTVVVSSVLTVNMPTGSTTFSPEEREILEANGVSVFTADGVSAIETLVYPVHAGSLQDIFYFPNIKILDLAGGDMFKLPELVYDRNTILDIVGGGEFSPFMRKAGNISHGNQQALKDFLEAGFIEKVYYRPNTMGLDELLMPYVESGIVELVEGPDEVLVDNQFHLNGIVQDWNWNAEVIFPATDAPEGTGLENVYKVIPRATSSSFVFALPREYQFNIAEYRYLKFKVYTPTAEELSGTYEPFRRLWPRFMNRMWSFAENSNFGQAYWEIPRFHINEAELASWVEITLDLTEALDRNNRVIVLNIGGEPWVDFNPPSDLEYWFANIRFTKEP